MIFKRRNPRSWQQTMVESVYPRGGWRRGIAYLGHRLMRLPDQPHRIARGVAAGAFISFTPLFGLHFFGAMLVAWCLRGNLLASLIGTLVGNPLTFPFIAWASVELGHWMLGISLPIDLHGIITAFSGASIEIWNNIAALFTPEPTHWYRLRHFFSYIFLPYLVGGILPGILVGIITHYLTLPLVIAYQRLRQKRLRERADRLRARARLRVEAAPSPPAPPPPAIPEQPKQDPRP